MSSINDIISTGFDKVRNNYYFKRLVSTLESKNCLRTDRTLLSNPQPTGVTEENWIRLASTLEDGDYFYVTGEGERLFFISKPSLHRWVGPGNLYRFLGTKKKGSIKTVLTLSDSYLVKYEKKGKEVDITYMGIFKDEDIKVVETLKNLKVIFEVERDDMHSTCYNCEKVFSTPNEEKRWCSPECQEEQVRRAPVPKCKGVLDYGPDKGETKNCLVCGRLFKNSKSSLCYFCAKAVCEEGVYRNCEVCGSTFLANNVVTTKCSVRCRRGV